METNEEHACRECVHSYALAINEWERAHDILRRIEDGKHVSQLLRHQVAGMTKLGHLKQHAALFARYVNPRDRKLGSKPGAPDCWGNKGRHFNVSYDTIRSVEFRDSGTAEVVTDWGYLLPGGSTMFVLKLRNGHWLIDSLKLLRGSAWEPGLL
jgi:hypothetical protein